jgi:phospholipid/cholesterol/gamma-HCH transport system ATP-binding protein
MKSENNIIDVKGLTKTYGELTVIKDLTFSIKDGEIFFFAGGSGCGKSTVLKQLIGLETPDTAEIYINGKNFFEEQSEIVKQFGVLFQSGGLFASMTLAENIAVVYKKYTKLNDNAISDMIDMKLSSVGLSGFRDYLPSEISGGMKKRAAIARAMALDPKILFLDEPSSGLDPISSAEIDDLIKELNTSLGITMVIISHDLSSIFSIANRVILLDKTVKGKLEIGTPEELKNSNNDTVRNFFRRSLD